MPSYLKAIILGWLILITQTAFSWDSTGHRVISAIAYNNLTPTVRQKIDQLTAISDPAYPALSRFLYLSTLPDQWRQNDSNQNNWHFIDIPWSTDGTSTQPPQTPNLITILETNKKVLTDPVNTNTQRATALAYVIHLAEDAHQPLHCINRFNSQFPRGDAGGNLFPLQSQYATNLHAYWDQSVRQMLPKNKHYPISHKKAMQLAKRIQKEYPKNKLQRDSADLSIAHWVQESHIIAQQKVYNIALNTTPSNEYQQMHLEIATRQLALAGYRLANLLNGLLR